MAKKFKSKVEQLEAELTKVREKLETKKKGIAPLEAEEKRIVEELKKAKMDELIELMEAKNMTVDELKMIMEASGTKATEKTVEEETGTEEEPDTETE